MTLLGHLECSDGSPPHNAGLSRRRRCRGSIPRCGGVPVRQQGRSTHRERALARYVRLALVRGTPRTDRAARPFCALLAAECSYRRCPIYLPPCARPQAFIIVKCKCSGAERWPAALVAVMVSS